MKRLAALVAVLILSGPIPAGAQGQPIEGTGPTTLPDATSPWRRIVGSFGGFSRAAAPAAASSKRTVVFVTSPPTYLAQLPVTAGGPQQNGYPPPSMPLPPPPAPPASAQGPQIESTVPSLSVPEAAAGVPATTFPPGSLVSPPNPAPAGEMMPFEEGAGPEFGGPSFAAPGSTPPGLVPQRPADPKRSRLRISTPPKSSLPPGPSEQMIPMDPSQINSGQLNPTEVIFLDENGVPQRQEQPSGPPPIVFRTRDVVRPDLMRGKNYRLAEYTPLIDYRFHFEMETRWGTIPASGMAMLDLRLRELCAIEYGCRILKKNPMFVEGVTQLACDTLNGAYLAATRPVDSFYWTASGFKRLALMKSSPGGKKANSASRRRLSCLLKCDPETRNPVLACLLDDMSRSASVGWIAGDAVLNIPIPGLGLVPANAQFKKMASMKSTREIQADLDAMLIALSIPESNRTKFLSNENFTTSQRMAFVYLLHKLIGIDNLTCLVDGAADAVNEGEALAAIQELQLLVEVRNTQAITRVSFVGLPVATLEDGKQLIATTADYIVDTPRFTQLITHYRSESPLAQTTFVTAGRVSAGTEKQLAASGIDVAHHRLGGGGKDAPTPADKALQISSLPGEVAPPGPRTQ